MTEKIKVILTNVGIGLFVFGSLYWCNEKSKKENEERINLVNKGYKSSKGIITDIKSYKGHSLDVKYFLNNKEFIFKGGWDKNPKGLGEGDSIKLRYSVEKPEVIINELEDEY